MDRDSTEPLFSGDLTWPNRLGDMKKASKRKHPRKKTEKAMALLVAFYII